MKRVKPKFKLKSFPNSVHFYYNGWKKKGLGYIEKKYARKNPNWIMEYKLFVPKAIGSGDTRTDRIKPVFPEINSCCSETYLVFGPFKTERERDNAANYINTKFFHFLVSLKKITQEARRKVYEFVPLQDFSKEWNDKLLYEKYGLTLEEQNYIDNLIKS